jgi:hypothetical protein
LGRCLKSIRFPTNMGGHFTFLGNLYTFHKNPPFFLYTRNRSLHIVRPLNRGKNSTLPLVIALGKHLLTPLSMGFTYHLTYFVLSSFLFKLMVDGIATNYACSMYTLPIRGPYLPFNLFWLSSFLFKLMVDGIATNYACSMYTLKKGINFLYYVESKYMYVVCKLLFL